MCRSLDRALTRRLYLLIRGTPYGGAKDSPVWHFPEKEYAKEDTLRKVGVCIPWNSKRCKQFVALTLKYKVSHNSLHSLIILFNFFPCLFSLQCAEEVIKPFVNNPADVYFVGNAPCGHLHYRLSEPNYKVRTTLCVSILFLLCSIWTFKSA